ncbi:MAG: hypothetical protein J0I20_14450 [Chloroflexi bacterium]|nr:hypothetical protein [Chloroflexota bacterium]OJW02706.1 MAG: hypothetical protein BGO39_05600 [Chloroflexi bacterium 54-19]
MTRGIKYKLSFTGFLLALLALTLAVALSRTASPASAATGPDSTPAPATSGATNGTTTAAPVPPGTGSGTTIVAAPVPLQAGAAGPVAVTGAATFAIAAGDGSELQGDITKIDGNKITVNNGPTINLNDQTVIGDSKGTLKASDLKVGDRVFATGTPEQDKSLTARWLLKLAVLPTIQVGTLSSVDSAGNSFKFKAGPDNTEWTAKLSSDTTLNKDGKEIKLSDIVTGDQVLVTGKADQAAHTIEATSVQSGLPKASLVATSASFIFSKVKSVDAANNTFTLDGDIKVSVDSTTQFNGDYKSLADLKAGDEVTVSGDRQADGSIKAKTVGPKPETMAIPVPGVPVQGAALPGTSESVTIVTGPAPETGSSQAVEAAPAPPTAKA